MKSFLLGLVLGCSGLLASYAVYSSEQGASPALVKRGEYLAIAGDCSACHSDTQSKNPYAGGYGIQSPLGIIYGSNITPSQQYGIGRYSLDDFKNVMRAGRAPGGHYLYPAMPYTSFSGLSDQDLQALYSYFMLGVAPVDHQVTKTDLPFPFSIRSVMFVWNKLFLDNTVLPGSNAAPGSVERGEYLVKTLGHCSTCHTPRNSLLGEQKGKFLAGGKVGGWVAPNITSDPQAGIGQWSEQQLVTYLRTGSLPGQAVAAGEMGTAVQNSFSKLTDGDLIAIARYIKSLPAVPDPHQRMRAAPQLPNIMQIETGLAKDPDSLIDTEQMTGAQLYNGACATCHASDGRGTQDSRRFFPSLVGTSAVIARDPSNLIMTIAEGVDRKTTAGHAFMPEFKTQFSPEQLAKVAEYVTQTFGGQQATTISAEQVTRTLQGADDSSWIIRHATQLSYGAILLLLVIVVVAFYMLRRRNPS